MSLTQAIHQKFPNLVTETGTIPAANPAADPVVYVRKEGIRDVMKALRDHADFQFNFLMDVTCVDYLHWEEKASRFEVVYNLFSTSKNRRLFVKVLLPETDPSVDSVTSIWPSADWHEREVWDMFGIHFSGHPNLKRILMYEGFEGHALRKDYPYSKRQPLIGPLN